MSLFIKLKNQKRLLSNFSYMFIIQILNYILPFVTIPYIVRTIGVEKFGVISFSYAFIAYFQLITNYGFKMLAVRDISQNRNSILKLSKIFWKVITAQFLLFVLSAILFYFIVENFDKISQYKEVFIFSFGMVIGNFLFPIWFFQGVENMKYIAIFNFISRTLYMVSIFIFVNESIDYIYIPLLNSISLILIAISSIILIKQKFHILFKLPSINELKVYYIEGYHLFLSTIVVNLYTTFNSLILGLLIGYEAVGIYSLGERIYSAIIKVITIVNQVLYPYLAKFSTDMKLLIYKMRYLLRYYIIFLFFISISIYLNSEFIISLLFGDNHPNSILILKILSIAIFFQPYGGFFTQYMVIKSNEKLVSRVTFLTMVTNFILVFPMIYLYHEVGLAITIVLVSIYHVYINLKYNQEILKCPK